MNYFKAERRSYCWVQLHQNEAIKLETENQQFPRNCYYEYHTTEGEPFCEYHIDTSSLLLTYIPDEYKQYGGGVSVRKRENKRPLIIVGQDKSTYHQYTFSKKQWKGPQGKHLLLPKSAGEIYMISEYQSREFGLGLRDKLTDNVLLRVNNKREGQHYKSVNDAKFVNNNKTEKEKLTSDPCLQFFYSGANFEGY